MSDGLTFSIDVLEQDLGAPARLRVLLNVGGQRRYIPQPDSARHSALAEELGPEIALWLADRFGGTTLRFPSKGGSERETRAAALQAAVLEAGLTAPRLSANAIARQHGVSQRRVEQIRTELRREAACSDALPLFECSREPRNASD